MIKLDMPVVFLDPGLNGMPSSSNVDPLTLQRMLYTPHVFKLKSSLTSQWKVVTFLCERPLYLILYLDSTLLVWLKIGPTKGKIFSRFIFPLGWVHSTKDLSIIVAVLLNILQMNFSSCGRLSWLQMAVALCAMFDSTDCLFAKWHCDMAFK